MDKFVSDRISSLTEPDMYQALIGFEEAGFTDMVVELEEVMLASLKQLEPNTVSSILYHYSMKRVGSHTFISALSNHLCHATITHPTDMVQAITTLNLVGNNDFYPLALTVA